MKANGAVKRMEEHRVPIVFLELAEAGAQSVCIAGTFNDWRPGATRMINLGDGCWVKELCLPAGTYEYRLVVDGEWIPNPLADEYAPSSFGGINSVLKVPRPASVTRNPLAKWYPLRAKQAGTETR
jgi:hypothetical protein